MSDMQQKAERADGYQLLFVSASNWRTILPKVAVGTQDTGAASMVDVRDKNIAMKTPCDRFPCKQHIWSKHMRCTCRGQKVACHARAEWQHTSHEGT